MKKFSCFVESTSNKNILTRKFYNSLCNSVIAFRAARTRRERQARAGERNVRRNCHRRVFQRSGCIWGYHAYKDVWEAAVGESLVCEREPENASDRCAVAVKKEPSYDISLQIYIAGEFAVLATRSYYRMYSNRAQEIFSWPAGTRRTWSSLLSIFQGNAYGSRESPLLGRK